MNAKKYLVSQLEGMWRLQNASLQDITNETLMRMPPGTISPIGVIWLHFVYSQDHFIAVITGTETLWQSAGWNKKFGVEQAPAFGQDWSEYQQLEISVSLLQKYSQAVQGFVQQALESTDDDTLDESVEFFTESDPKSAVWVLLVDHTMHHCGEISALKGIFGGKGLPY